MFWDISKKKGDDIMKLTKEEIHNLLIFLERSTMSGNEAVTFIMLREKLKQMLKEVENSADAETDTVDTV